MHPQFTKMQNRIDRVNQVLREQISGMRVVRAFVREPDEAARFGTANADLTETSLKTGRMMAVMFPAVLLTINISSVAAVWFGARPHQFRRRCRWARWSPSSATSSRS